MCNFSLVSLSTSGRIKKESQNFPRCWRRPSSTSAIFPSRSFAPRRSRQNARAITPRWILRHNGRALSPDKLITRWFTIERNAQSIEVRHWIGRGAIDRRLNLFVRLRRWRRRAARSRSSSACSNGGSRPRPSRPTRRISRPSSSSGATSSRPSSSPRTATSPRSRGSSMYVPTLLSSFLCF